jgi:hypothetical protein
MTIKAFKNALPVLLLLSISHIVVSQSAGNTQPALKHFGGAVTVTNNGISFIPSFNLGKPAAIFDLTMGGKKLSFEPQFRFALEGKPWSILFWWRYKLLTTDKFQISLGAHPALSFRNNTFIVDGVSKEYITVNRYLAGEFAPNYSISKNISVGIYYLYSYCLDVYAARNTNFVSGRINFSYIRLSKQYFLKFNPQAYYLKMDDNDGYYFSTSLTLARKNFPLTASSIINKAIKTEIQSKDFLWNVSLIYSFSNKYVKAK